MYLHVIVYIFIHFIFFLLSVCLRIVGLVFTHPIGHFVEYCHFTFMHSDPIKLLLLLYTSGNSIAREREGRRDTSLGNRTEIRGRPQTSTTSEARERG